MKRILLLFAVVLFSSAAYAQHWGDDNDYRYKYINVDKPAIEISYGPSTVKLDGYGQSFDNASLLDFKIGFSTSKSKKYYNDKLKKFEFVYFDVGNYNTDMDFREKSADKIKANNWRFGFGEKDGYMIAAGNIGILPYTSTAMMWTNSNWKGINSTVTPIENDKLLVFGNQFRFGSNYESGISFQVMPLLSFDFTYERNNVYPRFLFWKQTGSMVMQEAGVGVIDYFVNRVLRDSPVAGSVVNFVLKSAYYYGFNELKAKEMNWPFGGDASVNYSTLKFGLGFTF
ncbi:MAG: hypothetical protein NTY74_09160 [Ignavibacteriae bacterium]|nr:hypothetical protein [Ignavibacteriota bacterium]